MTHVRVSVLPANEASWDDLKAIFGTRGEAAICWRQRYKLKPREAFKHWPAEVRAERLREQTHCGDARAKTTSGLVAYLDGEPAGVQSSRASPTRDSYASTAFPGSAVRRTRLTRASGP